MVQINAYTPKFFEIYGFQKKALKLMDWFSNHLNNFNFFELVCVHEEPGEDEHHEHGKYEHGCRHVRIQQLDTQTRHHVRKLEQTIPNRFAHRLYILRHELRQH